jgi:hypothetical protein
MGKMRFHLKPFEQTYGLEHGRTIKSILGNAILASCLIAHIFMF